MIFTDYAYTIKNKSVLLAFRKQNQPMNKPLYLIILPLLLIFLLGCNGNRLKKSFNEGTIEYSIEFESNDLSKLNTNMLPNKLTIKFRDNNTSNKIEGLSGSVNLTFIKNVENKKQPPIKRLFFTESFRMKFRDLITQLKYSKPKPAVKRLKKIRNFKKFLPFFQIITYIRE